MAEPRNDLKKYDDEAHIIYRWANSNSGRDRMQANEAEEYIVTEGIEADSGIVIYGRYGVEIIANTWSNRALVKHLITENKRLKDALTSILAEGNKPDTQFTSDKGIGPNCHAMTSIAEQALKENGNANNR